MPFLRILVLFLYREIVSLTFWQLHRSSPSLRRDLKPLLQPGIPLTHTAPPVFPGKWQSVDHGILLWRCSRRSACSWPRCCLCHFHGSLSLHRRCFGRLSRRYKHRCPGRFWRSLLSHTAPGSPLRQSNIAPIMTAGKHTHGLLCSGPAHSPA